jgi:hypothetical protein
MTVMSRGLDAYLRTISLHYITILILICVRDFSVREDDQRKQIIDVHVIQGSWIQMYARLQGK